MTIDSADLTRVIDAMTTTIAAHTEELTDLDRAVGDGDHGVNMTRGFAAVRDARDTIVALAPGPALAEIGKRLVMTVGGASGPLYGTLFLALGKALGAERVIRRERFAAAVDDALAAVKARGKAELGQKTMLDVLVPVAAQLQRGGDDLLARLQARAADGEAATVPMRAQRGRASFLGERSIGHVDPGARSSRLLIDAVCASFAGRMGRDTAAASAERVAGA